jgi:replicative DNA helicase
MPRTPDTKPKKPRVPEGAKLPPQNLDAETSLLGAVLIDEDVLTRVSDKLVADDFYDRRHQLIYAAMISLYEHHQPVDLLTLADQLKKKGELDEAGGSAYLSELTNQVPTAAHAEGYADIITQNGMRRRLITASASIAELGFDETQSADELLSSAEAQLFAVSDQTLRQDLTSLEQILTESFDRMEELHRDSGCWYLALR